MAAKKMEQMKIMLVVGMSVILLFSLYFRFIRGKFSQGAKAVAATVSTVPLKIPQITIKKPPKPAETAPRLDTGLETAIRDIFSPAPEEKKEEKLSVEAQEKREKEMEQAKAPVAPSFKLKGIVVGGQNPLALIDNQFLRAGDMIGGYRVARIGKKEVLLEAGNRQLTLEMLKNE